MHVMLPPGAGGKGIVEAAARVATEQICRVYGFTHFQIRAKPFEAPAGVPASEVTDEQRQAAIEECERQAAHLKLWSSAEDDCAAVLGPAGRAPAPHGHARVLRPLADRQGKASGVDLTSDAALQARAPAMFGLGVFMVALQCVTMPRLFIASLAESCVTQDDCSVKGMFCRRSRATAIATFSAPELCFRMPPVVLTFR